MTQGRQRNRALFCGVARGYVETPQAPSKFSLTLSSPTDEPLLPGLLLHTGNWRAGHYQTQTTNRSVTSSAIAVESGR